MVNVGKYASPMDLAGYDFELFRAFIESQWEPQDLEDLGYGTGRRYPQRQHFRGAALVAGKEFCGLLENPWVERDCLYLGKVC